MRLLKHYRLITLLLLIITPWVNAMPVLSHQVLIHNKQAIEERAGLKLADFELLQMPQYCIPKLSATIGVGAGQPGYEEWKTAFDYTGTETYLHLHHYCWGLLHLNHALLHPEIAQLHGYRAVREFQYDSLKNALEKHKDHFFYTTYLYHYLYALALAYPNGNIPKELQEKSQEEIPDFFSPMYIELANIHIRMGERSKAKTILREGLKLSPNSKALQDRLKSLGNS